MSLAINTPIYLTAAHRVDGILHLVMYQQTLHQLRRLYAVVKAARQQLIADGNEGPVGIMEYSYAGFTHNSPEFISFVGALDRINNQGFDVFDHALMNADDAFTYKREDSFVAVSCFTEDRTTSLALKGFIANNL